MKTAVLWFRRDLRIADNPALHALLSEGYTPIPVYIHDEPDEAWPLGEASAWWLHHSLQALQKSLQSLGSDLLVFRGDSQHILATLLENNSAGRLVWNRCYEPAFVQRDEKIKGVFTAQGYEVSSHNAVLLREPWQNLKKDNTPYRVFTPFWKALQKIGLSRSVLPVVEKLPALPVNTDSHALTIESLQLLPDISWDKAFYEYWKPGEDGAWKALENFSETMLHDYVNGRNIPGHSGSSQLSPHLHFGEISPVQIWDYLSFRAASSGVSGDIAAAESFLRQIAWREFSHHLLYHFPTTPLEPMDKRFTAYPWRNDYQSTLRLWQKGQTGIPMVDAGMRELWATGTMHNRVRMIVASFLIKNLQIPWQEGARWFWNTLLDADLANNTMGWQWTAGCGIDASPFFRVFNPVLQGEKFDKNGHYIRQWIPELAKIDNRYIHQPWNLAPDKLFDAGVRLGKEYPQPIVDLRESRQQALAAWDQIKNQERS